MDAVFESLYPGAWTIQFHLLWASLYVNHIFSRVVKHSVLLVVIFWYAQFSVQIFLLKFQFCM